MKKAFLMTLALVFSLTTMNALSQAVAAADGKAKAGEKVTLENLEGLTEEQILALLKTLEIDDIMQYLKLTMGSGSRELMANMIGALNSYMGTLEPQKAMEVAQKATAENSELSFGTSKSGKPVVFAVAANNAMNTLVTTTTETQQTATEQTTATEAVIENEKEEASAKGSKD
jgi:hypothetical protein